MSMLTAPEAVSRVSIASSAMISELNVSLWTGRKKDKRASHKVTEDNNAEEGSAGVYKKLLGDCPELDAILKHVGHVRNHIHYAMTMPWGDLGQRLVTTAMSFDYTTKMSEAEDKFWVLVTAFLKVYDWEVAQSQAKLGDMYNPADYLSSEQIKDKFNFRMVLAPVPENNWLCELGKDQLAEVETRYQEHYEAQIHQAMHDIADRTTVALTKLHDQLDWVAGEKNKRIFESVFDTCLDMIDMLDTCNLTGDTQMIAIHSKLKAQFGNEFGMMGLSTEALKEDDVLREQTKTVLADVLKELPSLNM